jgi:iron complex transport system substrate-binding protein
MIRLAGGANVVTGGSAYPNLGIEHVLALDPDIVLNGAMAEGHGASQIGPGQAGWRELRAVKTGRVVALEDEAVLRPGPRVGDGLAILARALHPERAIP